MIFLFLLFLISFSISWVFVEWFFGEDNKKVLKKKSIKKLEVPVGHLMYSYKYGSVSNCTCEVCSRTWDLDYDVIMVKDLIEELDRKDKWEIKVIR